MRITSKVYLAVIFLVIVGVVAVATYNLWAIGASKVTITNRTDRSLTLSWVSNRRTPGVAIAQKDDSVIPFRLTQYNAKNIGDDDRDLRAAELKAADKNKELADLGQGGVSFSEIESEVKVETRGDYYLHHVTFTNLEPDTEYHFFVGNGVFFRAVEAPNAMTFPALDSLDVPDPAYGMIMQEYVEDGFSPASNDSVLYMQVDFGEGKYSQVLSSVTSENGSWYIDLSNARAENGEKLGKIENGLMEKVWVEGGPVGSIAQFETFTDFDAPMKVLFLEDEGKVRASAPLDFLASEVHAVCCNPGVCVNGLSFGDDPNYGGPSCDHRNQQACGEQGILSGGGECSGGNTNTGGGGNSDGNGSSNSGGGTSTGVGSCEGVSISCPAGWSAEAGVYCENGTTCKLKCVKDGESPWWHEGGSCREDSGGNEVPGSGGNEDDPPVVTPGNPISSPGMHDLSVGEYCSIFAWCSCEGVEMSVEAYPQYCAGSTSPPPQEGPIDPLPDSEDEETEDVGGTTPVAVTPINLRPYEGQFFSSLDPAYVERCNEVCDPTLNGVCVEHRRTTSNLLTSVYSFETEGDAEAGCIDAASTLLTETFTNTTNVTLGCNLEQDSASGLWRYYASKVTFQDIGRMCTYPVVQENLTFVSAAYAQVDPESAEVIFDPGSQVYYVGQAGVYRLTYEGVEYEAIIGESVDEIILYIDQDYDGEFDEEADIQIVEDPVELNIQQISTAMDYELKAGFNLVHFPMIMNDYNTASSLLQHINEQHDDALYSIAKYDDTWKVVGANSASFDTNDFQIIPGVGYLIKAKRDVTVTLAGNKIIYESESDSAPVFLSPGWNLMGIYGTKTKSYTAESLIDGLNGYTEVDFSINNVSHWSTSKGRYEGLQKEAIDAEESGVYGFDFPLTQKEAYFVRVIEGQGNWEPEIEE